MPISSLKPANDAAIVLIAGMEIVGDVTVPQAVDVHGRVDGSLRAPTVRVSKSAFVSGTIIAEAVEIFGRIDDGAVIANRIWLREGSDVDADLYYRHLDIDEGALFEGKSRRHENPMSLAPPPAAAD